MKDMESFFGLTKEELKNRGGLTTAEEIFQQPTVWKETLSIIIDKKDELSSFLKVVMKEEKLKIIFAGAGTSGYIGDTLIPYLKKVLKGVKVESVHTTDIVSYPEIYLDKDTPTLLFSFARSGNSPESVAAVELAEDLVDNLYQIIITCNQNGKLAQNAGSEKTKLILLPEESHDKGFAMTSSFTSMLLSTLLLFNLENVDEKLDEIETIIKNAKNILTNTEIIEELSASDFQKIIYLGSYSFHGLAKEAALKILELSAGKIITRYDTPLGFRHGPKSIIDKNTLIVFFLPSNKHARKYEMDLLRELAVEKDGYKTFVISGKKDTEIEKISDYSVFIELDNNKIDESFNSLNYILYAQVLALLESLKHGICPDNPSPDGSVNRVVKGVKIHPYIKKSI